MALTAREQRFAKIAASHGIRNAGVAIEEGRKVGIGPALSVAMLEQESGGLNVWGHDPTIFIGGFDRRNGKFWTTSPARKGFVNEAGYKEYKRQRGRTGAGGRQGVGPLQLTWHSTQDRADAMGGCWKPRINIRCGFTALSGLIQANGLHDGIRRYNGSGPRAEEYAREVLEKRAKWRKRFGIR